MSLFSFKNILFSTVVYASITQNGEKFGVTAESKFSGDIPTANTVIPHTDIKQQTLGFTDSAKQKKYQIMTDLIKAETDISIATKQVLLNQIRMERQLDSALSQDKNNVVFFEEMHEEKMMNLAEDLTRKHLADKTKDSKRKFRDIALEFDGNTICRMHDGGKVIEVPYSEVVNYPFVGPYTDEAAFIRNQIVTDPLRNQRLHAIDIRKPEWNFSGNQWPEKVMNERDSFMTQRLLDILTINDGNIMVITGASHIGLRDSLAAHRPDINIITLSPHIESKGDKDHKADPPYMKSRQKRALETSMNNMDTTAFAYRKTYNSMPYEQLASYSVMVYNKKLELEKKAEEIYNKQESERQR